MPQPFQIDAFHPAVLNSYRGLIHGSDSHDVTDVEFPTLHHATAWAQTCEISQFITLRPDSNNRRFDERVTVQFHSTEVE